jgi:hypothetical protein
MFWEINDQDTLCGTKKILAEETRRRGFSKCFSNGFCRSPAKTAFKLKLWRSHFAICTIEVKPKIVASRGFSHM